MKAIPVEELNEKDILEVVGRIENRYPPRMADIKRLAKIIRRLLELLNDES